VSSFLFGTLLLVGSQTLIALGHAVTYPRPCAVDKDKTEAAERVEEEKSFKELRAAQLARRAAPTYHVSLSEDEGEQPPAKVAKEPPVDDDWFPPPPPRTGEKFMEPKPKVVCLM
jgi:hypothetical protein